jgi:hypothetical protein
VATDRALPELVSLRGSRRPDWTVRTRGSRIGRPAWFHHVSFPGGRRWMSIAGGGEHYVVRFWKLATFEIHLATRSIVSMPARRTPAETVRHLLLDQIIPLVVSSRDRIALHGSAVTVDGGAVAFVGAAGNGKSTLAAVLAQAGLPVIADDCLLVERRRGPLVAVPNYPGLRLWPDAADVLLPGASQTLARVAHYTPKRRVGASSLPFARSAVPLRRIYVLGGRRLAAGARVAIRGMAPGPGMVELLKCVHCLDVRDRARMGEIFDLLAAIAAATPIRSLAFRRSLPLLGHVRDAVLADT